MDIDNSNTNSSAKPLYLYCAAEYVWIVRSHRSFISLTSQKAVTEVMEQIGVCADNLTFKKEISLIGFGWPKVEYARLGRGTVTPPPPPKHRYQFKGGAVCAGWLLGGLLIIGRINSPPIY